MDRNTRDKLICEMYKNGFTLNEIVLKAQVSQSTIYKVLDKYNIQRKSIKTKEQKALLVKSICDLFDKGMSVNNISKSLNVPEKTVNNILKKLMRNKYQHYVNEREKKLKETLDSKKHTFSRERPRRINNPLNNINNRLELHRTNKAIQSLLNTNVSENENEKNRRIFYNFAMGVSIDDIMKEFEISQEKFYNIVEASPNKNMEDTSDRPKPILNKGV